MGCAFILIVPAIFYMCHPIFYMVPEMARAIQFDISVYGTAGRAITRAAVLAEPYIPGGAQVLSTAPARSLSSHRFELLLPAPARERGGEKGDEQHRQEPERAPGLAVEHSEGAIRMRRFSGGLAWLRDRPVVADLTGVRIMC